MTTENNNNNNSSEDMGKVFADIFEDILKRKALPAIKLNNLSFSIGGLSVEIRPGNDGPSSGNT